MGKIVEPLSTKPRPTDHRQGLRKLSPELISKARDASAAQVTRIGLTFLGTAAFCLLSLLSPDSALLGGSEKIAVPFAGPVSFSGFMLLGPAVLIVLRVYLQIYVEHSNRLGGLARSVPIERAPTLVPLQNPLIELFSLLIFYLLLPVAIMLFVWKAAVFPDWALGLFGVAVAVTAAHVMLALGTFSWRRALLSASAAALAWVMMMILGLEPLRRPFDLERVNLSGQYLFGDDLRGANLFGADLSNAILTDADLSDADLNGANLSKAVLRGAFLFGADLSGANLSGAKLTSADLSHANLSGADLSGANLTDVNQDVFFTPPIDLSNANLSRATLTNANLSGADLSNAKNLTQMQLDEACGDANTRLPGGLTLKPCPTDQ
jgi:uncharacterized protein YjbI with pentapeptide repeats